MPARTWAELNEGVVRLSSGRRRHGKPRFLLAGWIGNYASRTPGLVDFGVNATVRLDDFNEPQPYVLVLLPAAAGGRSEVDADDYVAGAPNLVCEVMRDSSVSIDLHAKLNAYRRNGVREYFVWRTEDVAVDWFVLCDGRYDPLAADPADGLLKSAVFSGLWLDASALLRGDLPAAFAAVDLGTATPEHAAFVAQLKG